MALNDVSLTAGMRSNLLSLQRTVSLLNRTQDRLSTGKKVDSAIDNPTSYFAAQSLTSRASVIDSLKDAMGQAVQTISTADKGVKAITSMIEQGKGIAQAALSADQNTGLDTGLIYWSTINAGDLIIIGNANFTATNSATPSVDEFTISGSHSTNMQSLSDAINTHNWSAATNTFAASIAYGLVRISSTVTATGAARAVTAGDFSATSSGHSATMTILNPPHSGGTAFDVGSITLSGFTAGDHLQIGNTVFTAVSTPPVVPTSGHSEFQVIGNDAADMQSLADAINNVNNVLGVWPADDSFRATFTSGTVLLYRSDPSSGLDLNTEMSDFAGSGDSAQMYVMPAAGSGELANLEDQYNEMLDQITALAEDSGYKGKNLLAATSSLREMVVQFEGSTLTVQGFDATASGLGLTPAWWTFGGDVDADLMSLDSALFTLRQESSKMSGNLSIITVRQDFSMNMINTLTEGADKLTLADSNEEGANMLMLQTRQSLSTTALSLSSQAAQAVLRLFQ